MKSVEKEKKGIVKLYRLIRCKLYTLYTVLTMLPVLCLQMEFEIKDPVG